MIEQISYKQFFKQYLIITSVVIVVFGILTYFALVSKKSWKNNLKTCVEIVLEENQPGIWKVDKNVEINNPFTLNAACYEARNSKDGEIYKVIIIRVVTNYGPLPAVFVCDKDMNVELIGFSSLHGRVEKQIEATKNSKQIMFWKNKIKDIIEEKSN